MSAVLGVDPTATGTGAAVLRVDGEVVSWWCWTRVKAGWRITSELRDHGNVSSIHAVPIEDVAYIVGLAARRLGCDRLVVEGLHSPPKWKLAAGKGMRGDDLIKLAEATGRTVAGFRRAGLPEPSRPSWKDWAATIGCASASAKVCERAVLDLAMREGWLPMVAAKEQVATAEAGVLARWEGM